MDNALIDCPPLTVTLSRSASANGTDDQVSAPSSTGGSSSKGTVTRHELRLGNVRLPSTATSQAAHLGGVAVVAGAAYYGGPTVVSAASNAASAAWNAATGPSSGQGGA